MNSNDSNNHRFDMIRVSTFLLFISHFADGAIGIFNNEDAMRGVLDEVSLQIVDGHGRVVCRKSRDGIGRVREMETDKSIRFPNLRDGLTHEKTAITTGIIDRGRWCGSVSKGVMYHP